MIQIYDAVRDKSIVRISDRDDNLLCVRCNRRIIIQDICKLAQNNAGQLLLEEFISRNLEILSMVRYTSFPALGSFVLTISVTLPRLST